MKAEDKAKELVDKFEEYSHCEWDFRNGYANASMRESAKQCALICVDEIMISIEDVWNFNNILFKHSNTYDYWQEVKTEINKL